MNDRAEVVIVGGGVIGLSIAYALAREGLRSTVLDRQPMGREASWAGAGLLPSPSEAKWEAMHPSVALRSWSAELFPAWSAALQEETGIDNGFEVTGGVDVALTEAEAHSLRTTAGRWKVESIVHECLAPQDYHKVEPALSRSIRLAYFLPDRAQVRNPRHLKALAVAATQRGARLEPGRAVEQIITSGDRATAVRAGGRSISCGWVVVAAGAWSGGLLGRSGVVAPTPPLKGQIVLLKSDSPLLRRIVEHGKNYLVPRRDGRILIGATEESSGFDTRPTARGFRDLLMKAYRLCPALEAAEVEATWAGLRPGSIDTKPYLGLAPGFSNLIVATGHKRAGLQLSPATAELVADLILQRPPRMDLSPFRLDRDPDPTEDTFRS